MYLPNILNISTRVWVLHTPNAGQNMLFQCFLWKKLKKEETARNLTQNWAKKLFFSVCTRLLVAVFIPRTTQWKSIFRPAFGAPNASQNKQHSYTLVINWPLALLDAYNQPVKKAILENFISCSKNLFMQYFIQYKSETKNK